MFIDKFYKLILIIYLSLISVLSIYYLMAVNIVSTYNAMTEWVINYQGGFVRRGLIGEIVYQISVFFDLNLRFCFLILQSSLYLIYYYYVYKLFKDLKANYLIILAIFSPIFLIFPIAELEAIGRKEVLIFLSLIFIIDLYLKYKSNNLIVFTISIIYPILLLNFEASIFYSFFFISLIFITIQKINLFNILKLIIFSLPSLIVIWAIYFNPHLPSETAQMCAELEKIGEKCGLAAAFISKTIDYHMAEVNWKFAHIIRYFFIFILGFGALMILVGCSKFDEKKINKIILKLPFIYHFVILIIPTLVMFIIAVDTGRWTHMSYSCAIIFYFGLLKNKIIILNYNNKIINLLDKKLNNFTKLIVFILLCFSWNPKAVYHEDLGSIPLYRSIEKAPNYYNNILNIEIIR